MMFHMFIVCTGRLVYMWLVLYQLLAVASVWMCNCRFPSYQILGIGQVVVCVVIIPVIVNY